MEEWSQGVYLLGRFNFYRTGCWLLVSGGQGALVEVPPYSAGEVSPAQLALDAATALRVTIRYIFCTHYHMDHFSWQTAREFNNTFPQARFYLHRYFPFVADAHPVINYFERIVRLGLAAEPLYLVHAPKHSWSDTMVIFKGVIITGDWELNTIRSVHDGRRGRRDIPYAVRRHSIDRLVRFVRQKNYHIHKAFSAHANDRREDIDFIRLMEDTKVDRQLW